MILNPRSNSFYFNFPRGFFPESVTSKYINYIKKQPIPFDNVSQYVNSTIQGITFPSMSIDTVQQTRYLGKTANYKSSTPVQDLFSSDFSISFKNTDGFISYFIMLDTVLHFLNFKNPEVHINDLPLRIMDNEGNVVTSVVFEQVILTSFTGFELNFSNNTPSFSNFTVGFKCNYVDILLESK